jgi:hypothetical protein
VLIVMAKIYKKEFEYAAKIVARYPKGPIRDSVQGAFELFFENTCQKYDKKKFQYECFFATIPRGDII